MLCDTLIDFFLSTRETRLIKRRLNEKCNKACIRLMYFLSKMVYKMVMFYQQYFSTLL
jgi:hypothetical protein